MIALPPYIDQDAWQGFEDMRRLIKKPMTDRARKLVLYELDRLKKAGHCPNAALDQSTNHCWADVFMPKDKPIQAATNRVIEATQEWLTSHSQAPSGKPEGWAQQAKSRVRRAA